MARPRSVSSAFLESRKSELRKGGSSGRSEASDSGSEDSCATQVRPCVRSLRLCCRASAKAAGPCSPQCSSCFSLPPSLSVPLQQKDSSEEDSRTSEEEEDEEEDEEEEKVASSPDEARGSSGRSPDQYSANQRHRHHGKPLKRWAEMWALPRRFSSSVPVYFQIWFV